MKFKKFLPLFIILIVLSSSYVFAEDINSPNKLETYNNDNIYITETNTSIINYTNGEDNTVHVSTSFPRFIESDEYDFIGSFNVYVDKIDGGGVVETGYMYNTHEFDFNLNTIDNKLTSGVHRLYFGPSPFALSLETISYEYHPLTVVINTDNKINTVIWINQTSVAVGDKITGILTDGYIGLSDKTISFNTPNGTASVKTDKNGIFEIITTLTGNYSNFKFTPTDNIYNPYTSNLIVNVTNGKYQVIINENIVKYTSSDCYITGSISYPSNSMIWDSLWVWFNGNSGTATPARDSEDSLISMRSSTFKIDLTKLYTIPSGNNFTITVGPQYALENQVIKANNLSLDLDTVRIVRGDIKISSNIEILETQITQDEYITGILTDEYGGMYNKEISYTTPSEDTKTVTTDNTGRFYILANEAGIYKDFKFTGDNVHTESSSQTQVTANSAPQIFKINLNETEINYILETSYIISGNLTYPGNLNFNQNLYYTIDGNTKKLPTKTLKDKKFTFDLKDLNLTKTSTIEIGLQDKENNNFIKTNNLEYTPIQIKINILDKIQTIISFNNTNIIKGENIIGYLETNTGLKLDNKTITYLAPDGEKTIKTINGIFTIPTNTIGEYKNFKFKGDNTYQEYKSNTIIQVKENITEKTNITIIDNTLIITDNTITIYLLSQDNTNINEGNLELRITDTCIGKAKVENNRANLNITCTPGEYTGTLIYTGENKFNNYAKTVQIKITGTQDIIITIPELQTKENTILTISITVKYSNNQNVEKGNISLELLNKTYTKEVTNGLSHIQVEIPSITGTFPIKVTYKNGTYTKTQNSTITIKKEETLKTNIILSYIELEDGGNIKGIILDENNNPLNSNISLTLTRLTNKQSKTYTLNSNTTGEFLLKINLAPGDYSIKGKYTGNNNYTSSESDIKYITLTGTPSNVIFEDTSEIKYIYGNTNNFTGILKDKDGGILVGYHILLNVTRLSSGANKIYDVVTDYTGKYTLPINLAPGKYTIRSSINNNNFIGNSFSSILISENNSDDLREETVLTVNPFNSPYKSGETLNGYLKYSNNTQIPGHYVDITLSNTRGQSKTYTIVTNYNGYFELPITLAKGIYTAVCEYKGTEALKGISIRTELNVY